MADGWPATQLSSSPKGVGTPFRPIPLIPEDNVDDDILSDQDEPLEQLADGTTEQEAGSQLHKDFLQIMADG